MCNFQEKYVFPFSIKIAIWIFKELICIVIHPTSSAGLFVKPTFHKVSMGLILLLCQILVAHISAGREVLEVEKLRAPPNHKQVLEKSYKVELFGSQLQQFFAISVAR